MSDPGSLSTPPSVVALPNTFLADLVQYVASGPGGLASAAALSQTCKSFQALSDSPAVTYRDIMVARPIRSPAHKFWRWLARRKGRVAGLKLQIQLGTTGYHDSGAYGVYMLAWQSPQQALRVVPDLYLTVKQQRLMRDSDHPFVSKWLRPFSSMINHLSARVYKPDGLRLRDICEAAVPCRSLSLTVQCHLQHPALNLNQLAPVACSLVQLSFTSPFTGRARLSHLSTFFSLSHLTKLCINNADLTAEDPWISMAVLGNLKQLSLEIAASGDPGPLSALTSLSLLHLRNLRESEEDPIFPRFSFSFSSLQPLSTLQQLEVLELQQHSCSATSLKGLCGLSRLTKLVIGDAVDLVSLDGVSTALSYLSCRNLPGLECLAGVEVLGLLQDLKLSSCSITSLQPLSCLGSLTKLQVFNCRLSSLEGLGGVLSRSLVTLMVARCENLFELSGVEQLQALQELQVQDCGVTSLQPLAELPSSLTR